MPRTIMSPVTLREWTARVAGGRLSRGMAALNARHPWSHNDHFHAWVLRSLPELRERAIDVGCGRGGLLVRLAPAFDEVIGYDVDPAMRAAASARTADLPGVRVEGGDWASERGPFDLITMVAALHHLDVEAALLEVRRLLRPGGRLLVVGLAPPASLVDHVWDAASIATNPVIGFAKHPRRSRLGPQPPDVPVRDPQMAFEELRSVLHRVLPGAHLRHRLGFRHTIAWTAPAAGG